MNRNKTEQAEALNEIKLKQAFREIFRPDGYKVRKKTLMLLRAYYEGQTGKKAFALLYYPTELRNECKKLKTQTI